MALAKDGNLRFLIRRAPVCPLMTFSKLAALSWLGLLGCISPAIAEETGSYPFVEEAVEAESAIPSPTPDLSMELADAVLRKDTSRVRELLDQGADPNSNLSIPAPESWIRAFDGHYLSYYLSREKGFNVLMLACALDDNATANLLLERGADAHRRSKHSGIFPLHLASRSKNVDLMRRLMNITPESEAYDMRIRIDLKAQTASLWKADNCLIVSRISSGTASHPTPPGRYVITDKYKNWKSTIYKVPMPYFLRFSCGQIGLHAGYVPNRPASHGCIRLPPDDAREFFKKTPLGTLVTVE